MDWGPVRRAVSFSRQFLLLPWNETNLASILRFQARFFRSESCSEWRAFSAPVPSLVVFLNGDSRRQSRRAAPGFRLPRAQSYMSYCNLTTNSSSTWQLCRRLVHLLSLWFVIQAYYRLEKTWRRLVFSIWTSSIARVVHRLLQHKTNKQKHAPANSNEQRALHVP